jgi:hypothetical protein
MLTVNWNVTSSNITVNYNGETHILPRDAAGADKLLAAIKAKDWDAIPGLVSLAKQVTAYAKEFEVRNGAVFVDGVAVPSQLSSKILQFMDEGLPSEPLVLFAKNLLKNPSYRSVQQLFSFLEKNDHPITDTGNFIAYKKVRDDFKDCHTGTFDNSVGTVVKMPRNQVNEDPNITCSSGLHAANFDYATNFYPGGLMLEVEINPADVVAVPVDYSNAKLRVCEYKVLSVVKQEVSTPIRVTKTHTPACLPDCGDDEEVEDEDEDLEEDEDYFCNDCGEDWEFCQCGEECEFCEEVGCDGFCRDDSVTVTPVSSDTSQPRNGLVKTGCGGGGACGSCKC